MNADDNFDEALASSLFARLESLPETPVEAASITCVGLRLASGGRVDVFKAELANATLPIWRVQGLVGEGSTVVERRGLVLGTRDGRAILAGGMPTANDGLQGEPIIAIEFVVRPQKDLSIIITEAIKRRIPLNDQH